MTNLHVVFQESYTTANNETVVLKTSHVQVHVCAASQDMVCLSAEVTESIARWQETSGGGEYSFVVEFGVLLYIHTCTCCSVFVKTCVYVLEQEHSSYLVKVRVTVQHGYKTKPEVSEL